MSWLSWLVGKDNAASKIIDKVAKGADELHFSGEEKAKDSADFEKEVTKRWVADSEAPITRLVRPVSYIFVTVCIFIFGALDNALESFKMSQEWISLYKEIYIVMTIALFGSRGYEKAKTK